MGKHGHGNRWYGGSRRRRDGGDPRMMGDSGNHEAAPRVPRKLPLAVVLVGLVLWSLLAWALYVLVGPVLSWIAGNAGLLADSGKDLATTAGAGKEIGNIVDGLNVSGLLGQVIAVLGVILKPLIVIVWAIGALSLIAAPAILPKLGRLLATRLH